MLRQKLLPTPTSIAKGSTATFNLDLGLRYHVLWLELGDSVAIVGAGANDLRAKLAATVDYIRLKANGKVQRTMMAKELYDISALMGAPYAAS
ncbi:MAG: major capsid protein P2, partial [Verrucomicrobia bacterium]|nr:major capsid protein P2 [Verrucomicrobiota bacterium]